LKKETYTVNEAAKFFLQSPQSIRIAIIRGLLIASKEKGRLFIKREDLIQYFQDRWKRKPFKDPNLISIQNAAIQYGVTAQRLYYLVRKGIVKGVKKRGIPTALNKIQLNELFKVNI
jgi:hypothetical protein